MDIFNSQSRIIKKAKKVYNIEEIDFSRIEVFLNIFIIILIVYNISIFIYYVFRLFYILPNNPQFMW